MRRFPRQFLPVAVVFLLLVATASPAPALPQEPDSDQLKHEAFEQVARIHARQVLARQ